MALIKLYLLAKFAVFYKHNFFNPYILFFTHSVIKTVLVGKDDICISILVDYLNIVEFNIQERVLLVIPNECPLEADSRILPLFKFI